MSKDSKKNKYSKELWEKTTVIKDMVHGYIKIPKPIIKEIIDSEQFQRLKDIEQTGMEALYPSATHKRFTHSLGVYHLAKKAFREFRNNVKIFYPHIYESIRTMKVSDCEQIWCRWQLLFELASLLHDCGHSPFSHTLEFIYDLAKDSDGQKVLNTKLTDGMSQGFKCDFGTETGKPHERMSALYIKSNDCYGFRDKIEILLKSYIDSYQFDEIYDDENVLSDDIEFMMRMIIGCRYDYQRKDKYDVQLNKYHSCRKEAWYTELQLRNCIIGMLNSELDVDNLDYVVRDSKFSGYANHTVDLERLLSSFTIVLAFDVNNLSITKDIEFNQCINLRNFRGGFLNGRLTGSSHICCKNQNIKAHGRIILEEQRERAESNQRIYKTTDEFSAKLEFAGEDEEYVEITVPTGKEQSCAFIHFKGNMEGRLSGTIFVNNYDKEKMEWGHKGDLRIYFAYEQKCMSVLMSAVYNSNFEKKWIYAHHISTYTNDFLYIFLLEKYAEHILKIQKEKLREDLDIFLDSVKYEEIDNNGNEISDDTRKILTNYQDAIEGQLDDREIYEVIENTNKEKLAITNNVVREFIRICIELGRDKEKYTESFYNILQKCCLSLPLQSLSEETIIKAKCIFERYEEVYTAEMQIFSDILAMYDKPYVADGMVF